MLNLSIVADIVRVGPSRVNSSMLGCFLANKAGMKLTFLAIVFNIIYNNSKSHFLQFDCLRHLHGDSVFHPIIHYLSLQVRQRVPVVQGHVQDVSLVNQLQQALPHLL